MSFSKEDEESYCGGGEGGHSLGIGGGRSCLHTHWPSTSFRYPKEATTLEPIANKCLTSTTLGTSCNRLHAYPATAKTPLVIKTQSKVNNHKKNHYYTCNKNQLNQLKLKLKSKI